VLNYDVANVQAQQQQTLLQEFPDGSSRDPDAMQRGFEVVLYYLLSVQISFNSD
jgi:hypothetical protein